MSIALIGTHSPSSAMPGLPGAAIELERRVFTRELPGERVLAPAAADEQYRIGDMQSGHGMMRGRSASERRSHRAQTVP